MFDDSFLIITQEFLNSSKALADAAALCDDPIKQDMIGHIQEEFEMMVSRSAGIKVLVERDYSKNKDFIIEEMKIVTKSNYSIAQKIRNTLEGLTVC